MKKATNETLKENSRFNFYFEDLETLGNQIRDLNERIKAQDLPVILFPDYIDSLEPIQAVQPLKTKVVKETRLKT